MCESKGIFDRLKKCFSLQNARSTMDPAPHVAQRQIITFIRTWNDCSKINIDHTGSKHAFFELGLAMFGLVYLAKLEALADMIKNNHPIN